MDYYDVKHVFNNNINIFKKFFDNLVVHVRKVGSAISVFKDKDIGGYCIHCIQLDRSNALQCIEDIKGIRQGMTAIHEYAIAVGGVEETTKGRTTSPDYDVLYSQMCDLVRRGYEIMNTYKSSKQPPNRCGIEFIDNEVL